MKPYYDRAGITIYLGDCREVLPHMPRVDVILTDPVWPNFTPELAGSDRPWLLFEEACKAFPLADRLLVWLGCQSDPRFLCPVPSHWTFLRMCYLSRAVPGYNGRALVTGDVLYAFGAWPAPKPGRMVIAGQCQATSIAKLKQPHPCARNESHCAWVLKQFADPGNVILDPFCGSGTTLVCAKNARMQAIGIEIEERYCEIAANRLSQGVLQFTEE